MGDVLILICPLFSAAELFFGLWRAYSSLDPNIKSTGQTVLPPPRRFVFTHTREDKWRDYAKMNQWIMHASFPSASLEFSTDWKDRADTQRLWFFDRLVLADRAAAMRGKPFVATERYASAAFELPGSAMWFEPVRTNVVEFAGLHRSEGSGTMHKPVITYVNRQDWGRRMLKPEDHEGLVRALRRLEKERGWEVNIVAMDKLTREEQFQLAGRTTVRRLSKQAKLFAELNLLNADHDGRSRKRSNITSMDAPDPASSSDGILLPRRIC